MSERDETREAVARAILNRRVEPDFRTVVDGAWIVDHDLELADAALKAMTPGCRFTVEGVECVVVDWREWMILTADERRQEHLERWLENPDFRKALRQPLDTKNES